MLCWQIIIHACIDILTRQIRVFCNQFEMPHKIIKSGIFYKQKEGVKTVFIIQGGRVCGGKARGRNSPELNTVDN